jgi:tetratricopeptide (TPR) repeat protein
MSVALNSKKEYGLTLHACNKAIEIDATAVKAWYLRSVAYGNMNNFESAISDMKEAIKLSPQDKKLRTEFE